MMQRTPTNRPSVQLPRAAAPLLGFARLLRDDGFAIAPEQLVSFLDAVRLLGPRSMDDIREAALATLACPPDRRAAFDALFSAWFWGNAAAVVEGDPDAETRIKDDGGTAAPPPETREHRSGALASAEERLAARDLESDAGSLAAFRGDLPAALPKRRSFRSRPVRNAGQPDLRRSLRAIVANDGDVPTPMLRRRADVQRPLLLFIDISGSMKRHTEDNLRLAHAVARTAGCAEIFTIGTRLTRITAPLRLRDERTALTRVAGIVDDWDGGTRIGPMLLAFLSVPRFAALAHGAAVVLLSDGLERGGYSEMEMALRRLSARAFRLSLCTPLAADPRFRPRTAAFGAILQHLDDLVDGSSMQSLTRFILSLARPADTAMAIWGKVS